MSESYVDLLMSVPHWGFEITGEVLTALVVYPVFRFAENRWRNRFHAEIDMCHEVVHTVNDAYSLDDFRHPDNQMARAKWDSYWNEQHRRTWGDG